MYCAGCGGFQYNFKRRGLFDVEKIIFGGSEKVLKYSAMMTAQRAESKTKPCNGGGGVPTLGKIEGLSDHRIQRHRP
jgi:hypothetical protein